MQWHNTIYYDTLQHDNLINDYSPSHTIVQRPQVQRKFQASVNTHVYRELQTYVTKKTCIHTHKHILLDLINNNIKNSINNYNIKLLKH